MSNSPFLVVGLGNPGPTYALTRHNVGFWAVSDLADRHGSFFAINTRMRAEVASCVLPGAVKAICAKPTTFMNESGAAVRAVASFHKVPPERIVVIHDELDLDPGRLRVKFGGGDNGHNGLKSIRAHLATGDFYRVRVGIGRPDGGRAAADYVLARMRPAQVDQMRVDAAVAADAAELLIAEGLTRAQNRFNS